MTTPLSGGNETVLVVEDDALVRNFVIAQLHSLGYNTIAAADGRAALALVTTPSGAFTQALSAHRWTFSGEPLPAAIGDTFTV